jgi:hypothetical protein
VNTRMRFIAAGVCALMAGLLTMLLLAGSSESAGEQTAVLIAKVPIAQGQAVSTDMLATVQVDRPTRELLASDALSVPEDGLFGTWYALRDIQATEALIPGRTVIQQPVLPTVNTPGAEGLRLVTLDIAELPEGQVAPGHKVDLYVMPNQGPKAERLLDNVTVMASSPGQVTLLVDDERVAEVLTAIHTGQAIVVPPAVVKAP